MELFKGITSALTQVLSLWRIVLPAMFLGCLFGNWMQGTRLWRRCGKLMAPLASLARLPHDCSIYLAMCFLNHYSANAFLSTQFRKGILVERQLLAAYLIGWFPSGVHFLIFYIVPALTASVGWSIGMKYTVLYLFASMLVAMSGIFIGFLGARKEKEQIKIVSQPLDQEFSPKKDFKNVLSLSLLQFGRIALIFVPITLSFTIALHLEKTRNLLMSFDTLLRSVGLSAPSIIVIITGLPSSISAIAAAGPLFQSNLLGPKEVIISLLIAYLFHSIYEFFSSYLPSNIAFFGAIKGFRISFFYLLIRILSICLVLGFAILYF